MTRYFCRKGDLHDFLHKDIDEHHLEFSEEEKKKSPVSEVEGRNEFVFFLFKIW